MHVPSASLEGPSSREVAYLDPYRFLPPLPAGELDAEPGAGEEPVTTGTLFLTIILLMIIAGLWMVAYAILLER